MNIHTNRLAVFIVCHGEKNASRSARRNCRVRVMILQRVDAVGVEIGAGVGEQCTGKCRGSDKVVRRKAQRGWAHEIGTIVEIFGNTAAGDDGVVGGDDVPLRPSGVVLPWIGRCCRRKSRAAPAIFVKPGGGALGPFWMVAQRRQGASRFSVCQLDHAVGGARADQAQGFLGGEGVKESYPAAEQGGMRVICRRSISLSRRSGWTIARAAADPDAFFLTGGAKPPPQRRRRLICEMDVCLSGQGAVRDDIGHERFVRPGFRRQLSGDLVVGATAQNDGVDAPERMQHLRRWCPARCRLRRADRRCHSYRRCSRPGSWRCKVWLIS